ncbi:Uncharacterised protein [Actinobacillus porcinus]|uniref:Uncharacterized protein n=1 Tax=Actinobacillus porcinus TaxID=51048 RepID=A0ABY6TLZ9_9PAST|nr:hypothetical protein [Actinobacillus porcinus]VFY93874.1 Uncharacterised protein [Actinobacillus porcinus]VTU09335.1 Uncharacterised protein [Actinobacillus porcinus]
MRILKKYRIVYSSHSEYIHFNPIFIENSLHQAKRLASKHLPEELKNSKSAIIEIFCDDFSKNEPIASKYGTTKNSYWLAHPLLKDFDFWDFTGDTGY